MPASPERIAAARNYKKYYDSLSPEQQKELLSKTTKNRVHHRHMKLLIQKLTPTPLATPARTPRLTPTPVPKSVLVSPKKTSPKKKKPEKKQDIFDEYIASIKEKPRVVLPQKKKKKKNRPFIPKKSYYGHR